MSQHEIKRRLLSRLSRQFGYTAPALALVASGLAFQAYAHEPTNSMTNVQQAPMMLAEGGTEGGGEGEKTEGEAEGGAEAG